MMRPGGRVPCARAARWLYPALDGSLGPGEVAALEAHLAVCSSCRRLRDREVAFRTRLAALRAVPPAAPAALHARLRAALAPPPARADAPAAADSASDGPDGGPAARPPSASPAGTTRRRALWTWIAAVGAASVALGSVLVEPFVRPGSVVPVLVRSVAAQQAALAEGRLPLEVASPSSARIAAWLHPRLRFPVDLPPLAGEDVEVIGARLTELAAADAAAVVYRVDGREVALFTFPAAVLHSPESRGGGSRDLVVEEHHFRHYRLERITVTLWERGQVGYALAVPVGVAASRGCAVCHVGEENRRLERILAPGLRR